MNKNYRLVWNAKHFSWQVVSEIAKGGLVAEQSSVKKLVSHTAKLVVFFVANLLSVSVALAGPTGGTVSSGAATIATTGTTTTINQSTAKAAIDWSSFSTNSNEVVNFVQPNTSSITLNRVTGTSASTLNGQLNANGQVFIINPNGILFSSTSQVNTGGLIASTLNLSNNDFNNNTFKLSNTTNNKTVENRGKITVPTGGTIALIAPSVKQTGTIKAPQGNVLLAAGSDITLNLNNGSLLGYTINQGKAQALINSGGMIQADGGKVILTAKGIDELSNAVVNSVGVIQAQTVNNVRGVIELGSDLDNGTVNVSGTLDASAPTGGNGGQIKTAAANVNISAGTTVSTQRNTTSSLPPTTSGWELKAKNIDVDFFGGTVSSTTLSNALNKGNVTLNAFGIGEGQGNININDAISWNANTALSLNTNKDINFNSDLDLSADKAKLVMNYGVGSDYNLNNGARINITGSSPTLVINGASYIVINDLGEEGDANINTLQGMNNNLSGNYALGSNIDASDTVSWNEGKGFDPIGNYGSSITFFSDPSVPGGINVSQSVIDNPFTGQFHGLGHEITGLNINRIEPVFTSLPSVLPATYTINSIGLFGSTTNLIKDLGVINSNISGQMNVGGVIGFQKKGVVSNVYSNTNISGLSNVGGLIGASGIKNLDDSVESGIVKNSYANGEITIGTIASGGSGADIGGLIGKNYSLIEDSHASVNITADINNGGYAVGGLVGEHFNNNIINSYATGNLNGKNDLGGGLVGAFRYSQGDSRIYNSYSTGDINGNYNVGGLVGFMGLEAVYNNSERDVNATATIENSHATGNVNGLDTRSYADTGGLLASGNGNIKIKNSYASGNVSGQGVSGGLVGSLSNSYPGTGSEIINSYATGDVKGGGEVGGLIGNVASDTTISNSYASGRVEGQNKVGGLAGVSSAKIINNKAYGDVHGQNFVGGLIGSAYGGGDFDGNIYGDIINNTSSGAVYGQDNVGGFIGQSNMAYIDKGYATGNVFGNNNVGGLIGYSSGGYLTAGVHFFGWLGGLSNSSVIGDVQGKSNVGGLVGYNQGRILNSYSRSNVNGDENIGGLVGYTARQSSLIANNYSSGNISGNNNVGGIIGYVQYHGTSTNGTGIFNNYYTDGTVLGNQNVGGLVGVNQFWDSIGYWNTETSGQLTSAGGVGKTTAELKHITTFIGWDIADVSDPNSTSTWVIDENNSTPILRYNH